MEITPLTYEILLALADENRHGYGMIKEIEGRGGTPPSTGAMYLALHRMSAEGLVKEVPAPSDSDDARRKYYALTSRGQEAAERETRRISRLLETARAKKLGKEDAA
ncbi:MAG: PadR family transcriptional regulator [Gemmatimonadota bacterium]|nr:PadR family transcriptional regulator [Gemmatimonadota bacterium]